MVSENLANVRLEEVRTLHHFPVFAIDRLTIFTQLREIGAVNLLENVIEWDTQLKSHTIDDVD